MHDGIKESGRALWELDFLHSLWTFSEPSQTSHNLTAGYIIVTYCQSDVIDRRGKSNGLRISVRRNGIRLSRHYSVKDSLGVPAIRIKFFRLVPASSLTRMWHMSIRQ